jgi:hypothetical protein
MYLNRHKPSSPKMADKNSLILMTKWQVGDDHHATWYAILFYVEGGFICNVLLPEGGAKLQKITPGERTQI